jgi:hypothetical protein
MYIHSPRGYKINLVCVPWCEKGHNPQWKVQSIFKSSTRYKGQSTRAWLSTPKGGKVRPKICSHPRCHMQHAAVHTFKILVPDSHHIFGNFSVLYKFSIELASGSPYNEVAWGSGGHWECRIKSSPIWTSLQSVLATASGRELELRAKWSVYGWKDVQKNSDAFLCPHIQGVPGGTCQTSGDCSLC